MFLAIISDTYSEVKAELSVSEQRYPISEHLQQLKVNAMKKINCYDDDRNTVAEAIKNLEFKGTYMTRSDFDGSIFFLDDTEINWEKFRQEMLKSGVNDEEIRAYFERYDTDGNMALDQEELTRMQNSLLKIKQDSNEANKVIFKNFQQFFKFF